MKGLVGKLAGANLTDSVDGIFDQDIGNLAKVVKGTLSGGSPEDIADNLVGDGAAGEDHIGSLDGVFDQDIGNLAKVLQGTLNGGSPMDIASSMVGFDGELPSSPASGE